MPRLKSRFWSCLLACALTGPAFAADALAQDETTPSVPTISDNPLLAECLAATGPDVVLASCTKAIDSRQLTGSALASALFQRGTAQARRGKLEPAIGDFSAALKQTPDATDVLYARASAQAGLQRHEAAIEDLGAILVLAPNDADSFYRRAWSLTALGRDAEAVDDLNAVLRLVPGDIDALMDRGGLLLRLGKFAPAAADFSAIVAAEPNAAAAYYNRGRARLLADKVKDAATDFAQALKLRADNPYAGLRLYLARQRLDKSGADELAAMSAKFPAEQWPIPVAATLAGTLREPDLLASVSAADPAIVARLATETHYYLGMAAKAKGDVDAARGHFTQAAKGDRNIPEAVDAKLELGKL
jgi:lipoprotein NlpI